MKTAGLPFLQSSGATVEVAVPLPVEGSFTYLLDSSQIEQVKVGVRVLVPFKNREMIGFIVGINQENISPPAAKLKKIIRILDENPVLSERTLQLTRWLSRHYFSSWGEAIETAVPAWVKEGKRPKKEKAPSVTEKVPPPPRTLMPEQEMALQKIKRALEEKEAKPILLYGITGSGKTELYIRAIQEVLGRGKGAIALVPEIALTEQIRRFFLEHFGNQLEILHSKMSNGERYLAWKRIESGQTKVLLGPRSAIFAPMPRLGLILIDEEHEGSYKQDNSPRYHAREVAQWLAREEKALLILGSATPSLESMHAANEGIFQRIDLTRRVDDKALPKVTLVDLKQEGDIQRRSVILSRALIREIELNLTRKEGTLLLLNRRGFSTQIHCPGCGEVLNCPSCEVSLTYHQKEDQVLCHYCNFHEKPPQVCKRCKKPLLRFMGFGTEKVESELARYFPQAKITRMDADSVRKKGSHEKILSEFRNKKIDILVGTQMIAKGFDFPHVTLVGVILADVGLMLPDFRSGERSFQLLTQVAGRAGRGDKPGRVFIQTYSPDHPSVAFAQVHDYPRFFESEMPKRSEHHYPPYWFLINVLIRSENENKAYLFARELRDALQKEPDPGIELIGPAPLPFYRLRGHYRWHVLLKTKDLAPAQACLRATLPALKKPSDVALQVDVNPLNIL